MLHDMSRFRWMVVLLLLGVTVAGFRLLVHSSQEVEGPGHSLALVSPPFARIATAQEESMADGTLEGMAQLTTEAGISAWYRASSSIDLNAARAAFRTVEAQTGTYIIGSIAIPNMLEQYDVHGYAHVDGWMMTYYLRADPVAKIINTHAQQIDSTFLDGAMSILAGAAGVGMGTTNYYDFRYPNATRILFVAEYGRDGGNDFTIVLPLEFAYFERSWALRNISGDWYFRLNGTGLACAYCGHPYAYGIINASQMPVATTHTIHVDDWGVLVIVYREQ